MGGVGAGTGVTGAIIGDPGTGDVFGAVAAIGLIEILTLITPSLFCMPLSSSFMVRYNGPLVL